jgi:RimJ/RimL family protein N-acetyltransferase
MNRLLFDHDKEVSDWVGRKFDADLVKVLAAVGVLAKDGTLIGGAVLHDHTRYSVELSHYGVGTFSPDLVKAITYIVFIHAKLLRLSLTIPRKKKRLRKTVCKFGFSYEGIRRKFYGKNQGDDGIQYGMLKEEAARFLKRFEQKAEAA